MAIVRRAYELAAGGRTDREVGKATGLAPTHVAEILTNPFYVGRLRTGEPSALGALVDVGTWEHVQAMRARYSRRHRGVGQPPPVRPRRAPGLRGLRPPADRPRRALPPSGRLRGVQGRSPAPPSGATAKTNLDHRVQGRVLQGRGVRGRDRPRVRARGASRRRSRPARSPLARRPEPDGGDVLAQARIKRERDQAALRFAKDRDLGRLEATMARLDAEAQAAVVRPSRIPTAAEARAYLESLPDLWAKTSDAGRHAIAEAVFERIDVLGANDFTFTLTAHAKARGWDAAFGAGVDRINLDWSIWSGREDLNLRPHRPERCALPSCATPRPKMPAEGPANDSAEALGLRGAPGLSHPRSISATGPSSVSFPLATTRPRSGVIGPVEMCRRELPAVGACPGQAAGGRHRRVSLPQGAEPSPRRCRVACREQRP